MITLILHVGRHRTGTSTIQKNLFRNRQKMKELGWLYPEIRFDDFGKHQINHNVIANLLCGYKSKMSIRLTDKGLTRSDLEHYPGKFAEDILLEASEKGCKYILLSFEDLCPGYCDQIEFEDALHNLKSLFSDCYIKVLMYLRSQHDWCDSWYQWGMKFGSCKLYRQWYEDLEKAKWLNYEFILRQFAGCLGQENLILKTYSQSQPGEHIFDRFLNDIGFPPGANFEYVRNQNVGLRSSLLKIQREGIIYIKENKYDESLIKKLRMMLTLIDQKITGPRDGILPLALKKEIYDDWRQVNQQVLKLYFPAHSEPLFEEPGETTSNDKQGPGIELVSELVSMESVKLWLETGVTTDFVLTSPITSHKKQIW